MIGGRKMRFVDVPWWWCLVRWIPIFQRVRKLGHDEERATICVFFRNKAVAMAKNGGPREVFDAWADFFEKPWIKP